MLELLYYEDLEMSHRFSQRVIGCKLNIYQIDQNCPIILFLKIVIF